MNPFFLGSDERLAVWKSLRTSLPSFEEREQLAMVAKFWGSAPLMKCAYDVNDVEKWPGPWEMVIANDWCRDSIAVAMEFTLRLAGWEANRFILSMMRDYDLSDEMLVLKIDNNLVLNYIIGEVTSFPATRHDVIAQYRHNGRSYSPL